MKKLLMLPVNVLAIFTMAKSFKANPIIGSKLLNSLGLHVIRLVAAHYIFKFRQLFFVLGVSKEDRKSWNQNGFIKKENFMPQELFEQVIAEVNSTRAAARQCVQGDTVTWRIFIDDKVLESHPALKKLANEKKFQRLLSYASGRLERPMMYVQQIRNQHVSGGADPQKNFHSDTFQPTMKAWLFLEDVPQSKGPFNYIKGSNRLTLKRIKWEYKKSVTAAKLKDGYSEKGSFRASEADLAEMGLGELTEFVVRKNTLVVGNTHGFHRRGDSDGKATRLEIYCSSRVNPFSPFIGFGLMARLRDKILNAHYRNADRKAAAKGTKSSWHVAEAGIIQ